MARAVTGNRGVWQVGVASIVLMLGSKTSKHMEQSIKQRYGRNGCWAVVIVEFMVCACHSP